MIKEIADLCFAEPIIERKELHKNIINHLKGFFIKNDYDTCVEYKITFEGITKRDNTIKSKTGYIDLFVKNNKQKIGIEFDSGTNLKIKSIEKLIQSNANICIGIVKGSVYYSSLIKSNIKRINEVLELSDNIKLTDKSFWLIILSEKLLKKVF